MRRNDRAPSGQAPRRVPYLYLPAMWPLGLQETLRDLFLAWRWRRRMRRLLRQEALGLVRLAGARDQVSEGAGMSVREIAARNAARRNGCAGR